MTNRLRRRVQTQGSSFTAKLRRGAPSPWIAVFLEGLQRQGHTPLCSPCTPLHILPLEGGPAGRRASLLRAWPAGSAQHSCQQSSEGNLSCGHTYLQKALDIQFPVGGVASLGGNVYFTNQKKRKKKRFWWTASPAAMEAPFSCICLYFPPLTHSFPPNMGLNEYFKEKDGSRELNSLSAGRGIGFSD